MPFRRTLVLGTVLVLAACRPTAPPEPPNVILVLVDTLRAENLSLYGYHRPTSPRLEELAASAAVFLEARSQAPCTFPSANSILTGEFPQAFLGQSGGAMGLPAGQRSLAEILGAHGYRTAAVSASPIVRKTPSRFNPGGGFDRGFDQFDEECLWRGAECVNAAALRWIDTAGPSSTPFFLYLHYLDPHGPYRPPADHPRRFAPSGYQGGPGVDEGDPNPTAKSAEAGTAPSSADLEHLKALYDDEIAYFDARFGELVDALAARGLLDRTLLVLVADHGEEFFEHGHMKHCHTLFDTETRTPLLVRPPGGLAAGLRLPGDAANLDVVPTVLDYLGLPPAPLPGISLRARIEVRAGDRSEPPPTFSAWGSLRSVTSGGWKLVYDLATERFSLYDLTSDPGETADLATVKPGLVPPLKRRLFAWLIAQEGAGSRERSLREGAAATERLRSLGYL